jgi:hypothetical protein
VGAAIVPHEKKGSPMHACSSSTATAAGQPSIARQDLPSGWSAGMSQPDRHGSKPHADAASRVSHPIALGDRITVTLVEQATVDLQSTHERTRMSKTDIVNRAVSLYEFVEAEMSTGAELIVRRDGEDYVVKLL